VAPMEPTAEQTAVIADLHWLIHQGHVIEFANGMLDTAKKPLPRPPKPEAKPAEEKPAESPAEAVAPPEAALVAPVETAEAGAVEAPISEVAPPADEPGAPTDLAAAGGAGPDEAAPPLDPPLAASPEPPAPTPATPADSQT